jgi:hypothetical protein
VIATMRRPAADPGLGALANVLVARLDVQHEASIYDAGHFALKTHLEEIAEATLDFLALLEAPG